MGGENGFAPGIVAEDILMGSLPITMKYMLVKQVYSMLNILKQC